MQEKISVIGLGYVGLPLLLGLARHYKNVIGYDIDARRVKALKEAHDWTGEADSKALKATRAKFTANSEDMKDSTFFIVTVPTPIDQAKRPALAPVLSACHTVGKVLKNRKKGKGPVPLVVFESTVYPGLTEELCGSTIARISGLKHGRDFKLGYSPERINPGDKVNRLETIVKVVSAEDKASTDRVEAVYGKVITAGVHRAANIRVAEAAKVIENTQRDINIALMNEIAIICDRLGIRTHDVLQAAGTKWNFLKFTPGLVGGHCIGVDPYYLTARAEELGYHPQVILSGRRINDNMPIFVAQKIVKLLAESGHTLKGARVGILGLAFKENVRDLRNSRVPEIVKELESFGIKVMVHDPVADPAHARHEYGLTLVARKDMSKLDAMVLAVPHEMIMKDLKSYWPLLNKNGAIIDVKSVLNPAVLPRSLHYWSL